MGSHGHVARSTHRRLSLIVAVGLLGALLVVTATPAHAAPIAVNTLGDGAPANDTSCTLREAIINANNNAQTWTSCAPGSGADAISFSVTGTIVLASELPSVSAAGGSLAINGPGAASLTISGDVGDDNNTANNVRIITVESGAALNVSGMTIAEGHAANFGGGIRNSGGTLTVTSSTFSGNIADVDGGGIFNNNGTLTVTSSTFSGNIADLLGGGIWNVGTAGVTSSTFSGNSAGNDGGGIFSGAGPLTVTSSTFTGNSAGSFGGGIHVQGGSLTVTDCTFSANTAENGGAILVDNNQPNTITGSTFSGNLAAFFGNSTSNNGGGIYTSGTLTVSDSTLSGNDADDGGGIYGQDGSLTVTNSTFSGNEADDDDGGGIYSSGMLDVTSSTFSLNDANRDGGAIFNDAGTVEVASSTFSGNTADLGGGISNDDTLTITNSTFSNNSASVVGGGILNDGTLTLTTSTFSGNDAISRGGGIDNDGTLTLTNSTFSGNTTDSWGGGISNFGGTLIVTNSTLSGNSSASVGGGIAILAGGTLIVTNSTLSGNTAGGGGGISLSSGTVTLRSTIVANSPSGSDCSGGVTDGGYNLSSDFSCGFSGTSQAGVDPQLQPLANNGGPTRTMALPESSPAVDVIPEGQPAGAGCGTTIDTDQRGLPRPEDDLCDVGAYEEQDPTLPGPGVVPAPDVLSMSPTSGPVGTIMTISGTNLANALVRFNGVVAPDIQVNTPVQIVVEVPAGASTGPVTVATSGGQDSPGTFTVTTSGPTVSGFAPAQGRVGTPVVIIGEGFTGTVVAFGGVEAEFVVDSPTQITATVPHGAGTGPIEVTTGEGTGTSAGSFVVRHPRSVGLHFSRARGSVSVTDGWTGCASHVPVRLQRFEDGKFRPVASDTTSRHGAYGFGGIDEPGRYRVVAKRVTLSSGDVCLKAVSPVLTM